MTISPRAVRIIIALLTSVVLGEGAYLILPYTRHLSARTFRPAGVTSETCLPDLSQCRNDCQETSAADANAASRCYNGCERAFRVCAATP